MLILEQMTPDLQGTKNQWDQIDDFKWLKAEPSPHFSLLAEPERVEDKTWKYMVSGQLDTSVEEVLKGMGIR